MESVERITILMINIIILSFICDSVCSLKQTRADPGNDVAIWWRDKRTRLRDIHVLVTNEHGERVINCWIEYSDLVNDEGCIQHGNRITPSSLPGIIPGSGYLLAISIVMTNVSKADAGAYQIKIDNEIYGDPNNILYIFGKPQRPIITRISDHPLVGQTTNITCSAQSQSVPDEYRKYSQMVYKWDINNPAGNHFISGDTVNIVNVTRENEGAIFTCQAHEMGSSLVSDSSDTLTLDVYYIEDLNIHLDLSDPYSSTVLCMASCNPSCVYTWFDSLHNEIAKQKKINVSYSEQYTCMAQNLVGELSMTLFIKTTDTTVQPEELRTPHSHPLTAQNGQSSAVTVNIPIMIGLGVIGVILLAVTVVLAVLYLMQRRMKNHSPSGATSPPHNQPVYENTSFNNVDTCESADIENYSSLSGEREPPQPAVYEESSHQRELRSRTEMKIYENVTEVE